VAKVWVSGFLVQKDVEMARMSGGASRKGARYDEDGEKKREQSRKPGGASREDDFEGGGRLPC